MSIRITSVEPDGLGHHLSLKPGDRLLKINGRKVRDHLDYRFRISDPDIELELEIDGRRETIAVEKEAEDDLRVEFEDFKIRRCANDCVFCFVDQNPPGLREALYFRDGDYRLSFLYGHYITMTNMGTRDLERIVEQRLSPLYISIHATEPELRRNLFLYGKDDHLLGKLKYLVDHGIELHGQIVLLPNMNDGEHLQRTLDDLMPLTPGLKSVAIVPVGLTGHRQGLMNIQPVTADYARALLDEYPILHRSYRHSDGGRFVVLSDEWYILAEREVPKTAFYEDLAIEENGVGQVRAFLDRFQREQRRFPKELAAPTRFTIATGVLAHSVFEMHVLPRLNMIGNLTVNLQSIPNTLFGTPVTVAGLLSGKDFLAQLTGMDMGEAVWTTHRILNDAGVLTLDDMSLEQISEQLGVAFNIAEDSILEIFRRGIRG